MSPGSCPFVVSPDLMRLFSALGESRYRSITKAITIQKIAHMEAKVKTLNLMTQDLLDLFPFLCPRSLKRDIRQLRKYGIWKNKTYKQKNAMYSYTDIRISWSAIAKLAKKVHKKQSRDQDELAAMCRRMTKKCQPK